MNEQNKRSESNSRPKLKATTIIAVFLLVFISINRSKSDKLCESVVVDSITRLHNQTIVIFSGEEVWLVNQLNNELVGPCPIDHLYKEMSGPVDAALTISNHETITDFIGSSVYFENKNFYTFKNLGQYEVEWGSLIYLPHKGEQKDMAMTSDEAQKYMKSETIQYSYFDPIETKSKFVFTDGTVFSFTFDMGLEYDIPEVTTITEELEKYGLEKVPKTLTAAFTQTKSKVSELFLFNGSTFCSIKMSANSETQSCDLRPVKEFLDCDSMKRTNDFCLDNPFAVTSEEPIVAKDSPKPRRPLNEKKSKPESKVEIRSDDNPVTIKPIQTKSCSHSLFTNGLVFSLTFISIYI